MKSIKEKNFCDKCNKFTWHKYTGSTKTKKGKTKCLDCGNIRFL